MSVTLHLEPDLTRQQPGADIPKRPRGSLSVIVPAKNEEQNLPVLVERLFSVLPGLGRSFYGLCLLPILNCG
jgi:hypothetical protein